MKRLTGWMILVYTLIVLGVIIACQLPARCQSQFKIYKVDTTIGQTVFCRAREMKTDTTAYISLHFRGAGRKPDLLNRWVTFHPYGKGRIRHPYYGLNR